MGEEEEQTQPKEEAIPDRKEISLFQRLAISCAVILALRFIVPLILSLAVFKFSEQAEAIRNGIGREVVFDIPYKRIPPFPDIVKGKLTEWNYQLEPIKFWIIYITVTVEYSYKYNNCSGSGSTSCILSPFELNRIRFVEPDRPKAESTKAN